jgi:eukaryotic-like serine/threonine-protein kinase
MPEANTTYHPGWTPVPGTGDQPSPAGEPSSSGGLPPLDITRPFPEAEPTGADPRIGTTLAARYRIEDRIASGGMATVYRARDTQLDREVALKVMHRSLADDPGFLERFRAEARSAGRLNHPNVVSVYDYGSTPEGAYIVMELVDGVTLRSLLDRFGRIDPTRANQVVQAVADALDHAHASGVVHRDIKPENVVVSPAGEVRVLDFGIAKALGQHASRLTSERPVGTVAYVAPEQLRGENVDGRADIFALAGMTYEMLTGKAPFEGDTPQAIAAARLRSPELEAGISPGVNVAIRRATSASPDDRFETANSFVQALVSSTSHAETLKQAATTTAHLPNPAVTSDGVEVLPFQARLRRRARRRFRVGAAIALILAVVAALVYLGLPRPTTVPDVRGQSLAQALAMIEGAGLEVGETTEEFHDQIQSGSVIGASPDVGTVVENEQPIDLVVSKGAQLFEVPEVVGKPLDEARSLMRPTGFTVTMEDERHHDDVPDGAVISISPDIDRARRGTAFTAVVSLGPPPVAVPTVDGQSVEEARQAIEAAGLEFATSEQYSETVGSGLVIRTDPGGGGEAPRGSTVTASVSLGPRPFPMPNLVGSSLGEARSRAEELGLVVANEYPVPGSGAPSGQVQGQNPPEGTNIQRGSGIDLYYAN